MTYPQHRIAVAIHTGVLTGPDASHGIGRLASLLLHKLQATHNERHLHAILLDDGPCFLGVDTALFPDALSPELDISEWRDQNPQLPLSGLVHDLIPHIFPSHYLCSTPDIEAWFKRLSNLSYFDLLLTNSDSTANDLRSVLGLSTPIIVLDPALGLGPSSCSPLDAQLRRGVLCVSSIEWRKNLPLLIGAYAALDESLRTAHPLTLVLPDNPYDRFEVLRIAELAGLSEPPTIKHSLSDDALLELYSRSALFVWPSLYEGLGLPLIEALQASTPILVADYPAAHELIPDAYPGWFSPDDMGELAVLMTQALADPWFRHHLTTLVAPPSPDRAQASIARLLDELRSLRERITIRPVRTPLLIVGDPPTTLTGVGAFNAAAHLPLHDTFDVTFMTPSQASVADVEGRAWMSIIGNSAGHTPQLPLLDHAPVVELHDVYLSGMLRHAQVSEHQTNVLFDAILEDEGIAPFLACPPSEDCECLVQRCMATPALLRRARGIIVHSRHAADLLRREGRQLPPIHVVPLATFGHVRTLPGRRRLMGLGRHTIFLSLGAVASPKRSIDILKAWKHAGLHEDPHAILVFAGDVHRNPYGEQFQALADTTGNVVVTGRLDERSYLLWAELADVAIQLRQFSRGETSGAVLEALARGVPIVYNAHGSLAELPEGVGWRLDDPPTTDALAEALLEARNDSDERSRRGDAARQHIQQHHLPFVVARRRKEVLRQLLETPPANLPPRARVLLLMDREIEGLPTHELIGSLVRFCERQTRPVRIAYRTEGTLLEARQLLGLLTGWDLGPDAALEELPDDRFVLLSELLGA